MVVRRVSGMPLLTWAGDKPVRRRTGLDDDRQFIDTGAAA
jgi:hypothetical protein